MQLMAADLSAAAQAEPENLQYRGGRLYWSGGGAVAAVGRSGVKTDKHEGDHASPAGTYSLLYGFYRPDRLAWPKTDLPMTALRPNFGWCDAADDPHVS